METRRGMGVGEAVNEPAGSMETWEALSATQLQEERTASMAHPEREWHRSNRATKPRITQSEATGQLLQTEDRHDLRNTL